MAVKNELLKKLVRKVHWVELDEQEEAIETLEEIDRILIREANIRVVFEKWLREEISYFDVLGFVRDIYRKDNLLKG